MKNMEYKAPAINKNRPLLIVSFTSYPARIHAVPQVLESLYAQSMKPDRILLWLAEEQFPKREADLPPRLIDDIAAGKFELRWCDDIGSHKKYFYAMLEFPDDIVVIVDDDQLCPKRNMTSTSCGHSSDFALPSAINTRPIILRMKCIRKL